MTQEFDERPARRRIGCALDGSPLSGVVDAARRFHMTFAVTDAYIDELDHVNNAVWVVWIQDISVAHWYHAASPAHRDLHGAVVLHHDISYRANVGVDARVRAETWIEGLPRGARYTRCVRFLDEGGKLLVSAVSQWGLIDRSGRLVRVTPEIAAPFLRSEIPN